MEAAISAAEVQVEAGKPDTNSKYGEEFERQVRQLLDAHGASHLREHIYLLARANQLSVKYILVLEEIRRVETLGSTNRPTEG